MEAFTYKPTRAEQGKIQREVKIAALSAEPSGLLAYANMQLADAIKKQTAQHATGHLGGFNFQWAWSSAYASAQSLAK